MAKSYDSYESSLSKIRAGNYEAALASIERAIQIELNKPVVFNSIFCKYYNVRGLCKENLGDRQGANSDYRHAICLNRQVSENHLASLIGYRRADKVIDFKPINSLFQINYIEADRLYIAQYRNLVSFDLYKVKKKEFVQSWVEKYLDNKPDLEQSTAIAEVNSHVQLVARAGSGKTSTLVNRAIFLQRHCGIKSSEILILAFNRKAAQEIRERLQKYLQNDLPYAMTFHALAYALVRPDETLVYNEMGGQQAQSRLIQSVINDYLRDSVYYERIKSLMIRRFKTEWFWLIRNEFNLTPEEKLAAKRTKPQMGIDGVTYKSIGEKFIADFLFEHDIPFIYERNFWWGYGEERTNYHPDFTILKKVDNRKGIVIEYFGLQGDPNYDQQSEKKRRYWQNQSDFFFVEINPNNWSYSTGRNALEQHLSQVLTEIGLGASEFGTKYKYSTAGYERMEKKRLR